MRLLEFKIFHERQARAGDFLRLLRQKRTRARWGLLPEPEMRSRGF